MHDMIEDDFAKLREQVKKQQKEINMLSTFKFHAISVMTEKQIDKVVKKMTEPKYPLKPCKHCGDDYCTCWL
ncbi:hypothetical protein [Cytobacillus sp. FSL R5-0596]|uniref:hypothetical protein n=1 Tax=Cytobacillus sp. FSL R5-0596 TaxID=2954696 RepID=UPI0030F54C9A